MKYLILTLILSTLCYGQESFTYETQYKGTRDTIFEKKNFSFIYDEELKRIKMFSEDFSYFQSYLTMPMGSGTSDDGKGLTVGYRGDMKKMQKKGLSLSEVPLFHFVFDKKLSKLVWIRVDYYDMYSIRYSKSITLTKSEWFYTEYGIQFKKENYPSKDSSVIPKSTN